MKTNMAEQAQQNEKMAVDNVDQRIELIPTHQIITEAYQRDLTAGTVAKIVSKFDPAKLGVLVVNRRTDGSYAVLDGQHRLAALRTMGIPGVKCIVLEGLTPEQEADYFRFQNENKRNLTAIDLFNAGVYAGDVHYTTLKYLLEKYGFRVGRTSGSRCIAAVDALSRVTQIFGFDTLELVLAVIAATWPTDATIVRREMLAGLAEFAARFRGQFTVPQFAARMRMKHPSEMLYDYQRRTEGRGTTRNAFNPGMRFTLCAVIVEAYNKGLTSNSKQRLRLDWYEKGAANE